MNARTASISTRWNWFWFRAVSPDSLGLLRLIYGMVLVAKMTGGTNPKMILRKGFSFPKRGLFDISEMLDSWCMPYKVLEWLPQPTPFWYNRIEEALLVLSILVCVGLMTRIVLPLMAVLFTYTFFLSQFSFLHNSFLFLNILWILSFTPCGRTYSLDALLSEPDRRRKPVSILPLRLIQVLVCSIYLLTFLSKCNSGWFTGQIMVALDQWGVKGPFAELVMLKIPPQVRSLSALGIEGILPIALFVPSLRRLGIFLGVSLHLSLDLCMGIGTFSYQMMALYIAFIHPASGATVVIYDGLDSRLRRARRFVNLLDWFRRLTWLDGSDPHVAGTIDELQLGQTAGQVHVVTADGRRLWGFEAKRYLLASLPPTFLLASLLWVPPAGSIGRRLEQRRANRDGGTRAESTGSSVSEAAPPWQQTLEQAAACSPNGEEQSNGSASAAETLATSRVD